MASFEPIGYGYRATSKKGIDYLRLTIDAEKLKGNELFVFKNKFRKTEKSPHYMVCAVMEGR